MGLQDHLRDVPVYPTIADSDFQFAKFIRRRDLFLRPKLFTGCSIAAVGPITLIREPVPFGTVHYSTDYSASARSPHKWVVWS